MDVIFSQDEKSVVIKLFFSFSIVSLLVFNAYTQDQNTASQVIISPPEKIEKPSVDESNKNQNNFQFKAIKNPQEPSSNVPVSNEETTASQEFLDTNKNEQIQENQIQNSSQTVDQNNSEEISEEKQIISEPNQNQQISEEEKDQILSESEKLKAEEISEEIQLKIKSYLPPYNYDPTNKKDPFAKPGILIEQELKTDIGERLHPVENESITAIKLKAILSGKDGIIPRALFETSDGKAYTLTKNDRLGEEGAVIYRIDADRVWAMQPFFDPNTGNKAFKPFEKKLGDKETEESFYYEKLQ